jgi:leucyl aminopeptidase (aminopeptidase T)
MLYSTVYDNVINLPAADRPRYLCMCGATPGMLKRIIGDVDLHALKEFQIAITEYTRKGKKFRVTTPAGTDVTFVNSPLRDVNSSHGDISKKGMIEFMPGQVGWAPEFDSVNGLIVVDGAMSPPLGKLANPIHLTIEKGYIKNIEGNGTDAAVFSDWLNSFNHPNMYLSAHICYGFGPKATLCGDVVEDERVWGCTEWGWGNVGATLTPDIPGGIPAPAHTDGICLNSSVWIDGVQVLDKGTVVGPNQKIIDLAHKLGR